MQYKQYFVVGILFFLSLTLYAQESTQHSLYGYVKDVFGKPVSGATVSISGTDIGVTTESDGFYRLSKISTSLVNIRISSVGFIPEELQIVLSATKETAHDFQLKRDEKSIGEVAVFGKSENQRKVQEIKQSGYAVNVIDMNEHVDKVADLNQLLRRSPGVTIREDGGMGSDFAFKINGLDAKIFIDGVPMENFGSSMTLNNIPVSLVDRVEVYKGVVPAYLPTDVLGGAVNIITKRKNRQFFDFSYGYGSFNTHQASLIASVRNPKTGLMVKADAFYNHSDNDYMMYSNPKYGIDLEGYFDESVDEESGIVQRQLVKIGKARRFNDAYSSGMGKIETGFENVKWADRFFVGLTYSKNHNQLLQGSSINSLYGGRWSEENFFTPSIQYRKNSFLLPNLFVDIYASYGNNRKDVRDTAQHVYYWAGIPQAVDTIREQTYDKLINKSYIAKADFSYNLNSKKTQILNLSYNLTTNQQKTYNMLAEREADRDQSGLPKSLKKHLINIAWQGQWLNDKLTSVAFVKYYGMDVLNTKNDRTYSSDGTYLSGSIYEEHSYKSYKAMGFTLRYLLKNDIGLKASAEKSYTLPEVSQLFGDGVNVLGNPDLKPAESNNLNAGVFFNSYISGVHFVNLDITAFLRNTGNYIQTTQEGNYFIADNIEGARLYGLELDARYGYKDLIRVTFNGSYDRAIFDELGTEEQGEGAQALLGQQIGNRPWLYGNFDVSFGKNDWLGSGTRIELTAMNQYTKQFYLSPSIYGSPSTKSSVPSQYVHSVLLSFSWKHNRYGISAEARNLTDSRLYDNFGLQKAGRSFYTKFRVSIL
ncbi:TonB-dependent receptor [Sphingobacterium sp. LRF_L2]|uniref:TonB-dependent receptor n=1 Tax=Sphingobacterium sp. LRF_L2 TaxID=3369421 RepID=UPI003F5EFE09